VQDYDVKPRYKVYDRKLTYTHISQCYSWLSRSGQISVFLSTKNVHYSVIANS